MKRIIYQGNDMWREETAEETWLREAKHYGLKNTSFITAVSGIRSPFLNQVEEDLELEAMRQYEEVELNNH